MFVQRRRPHLIVISAVAFALVTAGLLTTTPALAQPQPDPPAQRMYVAVSPDDLAGPTAVVVFDVAEDGSLTQHAAAPYPTGGDGRVVTSSQPVAADADGRFLFVGNNESSNLSTFAISPADGSLSLVPSSPLPLASLTVSIAAHPTLPRLYVPEAFNQLRVYGIQNDGSLQLLQSLAPPATLCSVVVHPSGAFVYAISGCFGGSTVRAYAVAADGTLSETADSPFPVADSRLFFLAVAPAGGDRLYALDLDLGVFAFTIDTATGGLTQVTGSPFPAGAFVEELVVTPDDAFVYTTEPFSNAIHGLAAQPDASLLPVPGSPFTGDYVAAALLASANAPHLYLVGRETGRISPYEIDGDGRLFPLGPRVDVVDADGRVPVGAVLLGDTTDPVGACCVPFDCAEVDVSECVGEYQGDGTTCDEADCSGPLFITLCHVPPGNPGNAHTITVGLAAAQAHLNHGDTLGPCGVGVDPSVTFPLERESSDDTNPLDFGQSAIPDSETTVPLGSRDGSFDRKPGSRRSRGGANVARLSGSFSPGILSAD